MLVSTGLGRYESLRSPAIHFETGLNSAICRVHTTSVLPLTSEVFDRGVVDIRAVYGQQNLDRHGEGAICGYITELLGTSILMKARTESLEEEGGDRAAYGPSRMHMIVREHCKSKAVLATSSACAR